MKRIAIGLMLCMLGVAVCTVSVASDNQKQAEPAPDAVWDTVQYEFPAVLEGQAVTHSFKVRNAGEGILEIRKVKTS